MAVVQKLLSTGGFGGSSNGSCLTNYFFFSSQHVAIPIVVAGSFRNWRIQTTAPGVPIGLTIKKNGSNTALSVSFAASDTVKSDSDSVAFAAGDLFDIQRTANPSTSAFSHLEWVPDDGESQLYSFTTATFVDGRYIGVLNTTAGDNNATEASVSSLVGVDGTVTGIHINTGGDPGVGKSRIYTLYKNGVAQDGSGGTVDTRATNGSGTTTASATFSLSVSAGDRLSLRFTATGGATNANIGGSLAFVGATETVMYGAATTEALATTAGTSYRHTYPRNTLTSSATESDVEFIGADGLTIGGMRVYVETAPSSTHTRVFTLRKNGADTDLAVSLSGATQAGSDSVSTAIAIGYGDTWAVKEVRTGTPSASVLKVVFTSGSTLSTLNAAFGSTHTIDASTHCFLAGIENNVSGAVNCEAHGEGAGVEATQTVYFNQTTTPDTETDDHTFRVDADDIKLNGTVTVNGSPISGANAFGTIVVSGQSDVVADSSSDTLTLVAGSNVTLTTNAGSDSVTIAASGGGGNSFTTIAVSGQSDVVADSSSDTLTLAAGSNITITTNAGTDTITITGASVSGAVLVTNCNGRLTTESGVPVSTSDRSSQSTIYFTPYNGNQVALYNGSDWAEHSFTERSLALSSLTSGKNYDVFLYDNAGTLTLELSAAWTNDTTRADALALQDGVYVKSGATTRRLIGTIRTTGTTTTEDSATRRFVWNAQNRVRREMAAALETADSWTYTTATYRQANANTANQLMYVVGLNDVAVRADVRGIGTNSGSGLWLTTGVGVNSTSANSSRHFGVQVGGSRYNIVTSHYEGYPGIGYNFLVWLERSEAASTSTWLGDGTAPTYIQAGISGTVWN